MSERIKVLGGDTSVTRLGPGRFEVVVEDGDLEIGQVGREEAEIGTQTALIMAEEMLLAVMQQEEDKGEWLKSLHKRAVSTKAALGSTPIVVEFPGTFKWDELRELREHVQAAIDGTLEEEGKELFIENLLPLLETLVEIHSRST